MRPLCAAPLLVALLAGPAAAAITVDAGGGLALPVSDLSDYWNLGFSTNATALFELTPFAAAGVSASYSQMPLDKDAYLQALRVLYPSITSVGGGGLSVLTACAEFRAKTGAMDRALVYACAGTGFHFIFQEDVSMVASGQVPAGKFDTETRLGGYLGAGFGAPVSPTLKLGAEVRYNVFSVETEEGVFPDVGDTRSFLTIRAVVIFGL
jgi:opacity protein-like surface antigen